MLGHLLGQPATGRFLQYFASLVLTAAIWWYLDRRHVRLAPLWALLVGTTPQIVWQSSTAYDDALSALWCVGLAITVIYTLDDRRGCGGLHGGIVMGLAAGSCLAGKLTLAAFVAAVCAGWWWRSTGRRRQRLLSGIGVFCGAVIVWAPQPAWLWVSTGNPVFPFFNNIFRSPDFPLTATNFNFPYYKPHGITALLLLPFTTSWSPSKLVEATPTAAYGALLLLMFAALLIGWNRVACAPGGLDRDANRFHHVVVAGSLLALPAPVYDARPHCLNGRCPDGASGMLPSASSLYLSNLSLPFCVPRLPFHRP